MYVHRLTLENWKSHKNTEFTFGKVNLVRGANNSGKSSVGAALEFLLTGRCIGTQEAGQGADRIIRQGTKQSTVSADIGTQTAPTMHIDRFRTQAGGSVLGKMNGRQYAGKQIEEMFDKKGWNKAVLSAALRAGRFLALSPAEQKELLADVLKPESVVVPAEIQQAMAKCFEGQIVEKVDLEAAREFEVRATKLRAECTAALREIGEPAPVEERPKNAPTLAQTQARLDQLRTEQKALVREKEKKENAWAERQEKRRQLPIQIEQLAKRILSDADEKRYMEATEHAAETNKALAELQKINIQIEDYQAQIRGAAKHAGKCPTCGHETDTEELTARLEKSISAAESRIPGIQATLDRYADAKDAQNALRIHREAIVDSEQLKRELAVLPKSDVLPDTKKDQEQLDELEGRIQKGQSILADLSASEQRRQAFREATEKRAVLAQKRESADVLAKWAGAGSGGVQSQMASGKLGAFTDAINAVLGKFGYACSIELEPYEIRARRLDGDASLELASLSESESWRFSMAFQAAIAKATGLSLVVLDRADVLVGPNRSTMLKTILSCNLDQVFLLASVDNLTAKLPPEITVFDLSLNGSGETTIG